MPEPPRDPTVPRVTPGVADVPSINPNLKSRREARPLSVDAYVGGILSGDRVVLGRAVTLIESAREEHQQWAAEVLEQCLPHAGRSIRVGTTGAPGVGKSTFIEAVGLRLVEQGHRLAVLAIDPTSERTGGSILGDKTRMERLAADERAFVRPSPTGGTLGGVARQTREVMLLCEAAGYDTVIVETVGVGQSETAVRALVDVFLLLVQPGAGDELQGLKRGIMEMADVLAVTKADGGSHSAAKKTRGAYRNALHLFPPTESDWQPPVLICSALTGEGLEAVWQAVLDCITHTRENGFFDSQRARQATFWLHRFLDDRLRARFFAQPGVRDALNTLESDVAAGHISPRSAVNRLLDRFSIDERDAC